MRWGTKQRRTQTRAKLQQGVDGEKPTVPFFFFFFLISGKAIFFNILYSLVLPKAPPGINPLEHEELPMSVQRVHQNIRPTLPATPLASTEQYQGVFSHVKILPMSFSIKADSTVSLYKARVNNRNVILRVLKGTVLYNEVLYFIINRFNCCWWYFQQLESLILSQNYTKYCECAVSIIAWQSLLFLRNSQQQWEAALFGLCFLPEGIRSAPILAYHAGCDFSPASPENSDGGAAAPRSARVPVEVSAGRGEASCLEIIIDIYIWSLTFQLHFTAE